jgi:hypothetical protein
VICHCQLVPGRGCQILVAVAGGAGFGTGFGAGFGAGLGLAVGAASDVGVASELGVAFGFTVCLGVVTGLNNEPDVDDGAGALRAPIAHVSIRTPSTTMTSGSQSGLVRCQTRSAT